MPFLCNIQTDVSFALPVSSIRKIISWSYSCVQSHSSHVQLFVTIWMVYSLPGSSVHGIVQARILEWVVMLSSRGSSWPRDLTRVPWGYCTAGRFFTTELCRKINHINSDARRIEEKMKSLNILFPLAPHSHAELLGSSSHCLEDPYVILGLEHYCNIFKFTWYKCKCIIFKAALIFLPPWLFYNLFLLFSTYFY